MARLHGEIPGIDEMTGNFDNVLEREVEPLIEKYKNGQLDTPEFATQFLQGAQKLKRMSGGSKI